MARTLIFTVLFTSTLIFPSNFLKSQGIYLHDLDICGVSNEVQESSQELPEEYVPICTDPNKIKSIRVAIHFLLPGNIIQRELRDCDASGTTINYIGLGNFTESGDGFSNSGYSGYQRAEDIINQANAELGGNSRKAGQPRRREQSTQIDNR